MAYYPTKYLLVTLFLLISQISFCQDDIKIDAFKTFNFRCYGQSDSIMLPDDCVGPRYYNYEEGCIISFNSPDSARVDILCGGDAVLTINKAYVVVDSILDNGKIVSSSYYDKITNKYARKDYILNSTIIYENVSEEKKYEYNMLFNMFTEDRKKN